MSTRIIRPKTQPPYVSNNVSVSARTFAAVHASASITQDPPAPTDAGVHYGYDITQDGYNYGGTFNSTAIAAMASIPNALITTHIGGFGVYPPETSNGVYDWGGEGRGVPANGLDDGVAHVQSYSGATSIDGIILCTCPGWMKDSGNDFAMEEAPNAGNINNFGDLCADIVNRYTTTQWYPFWNEMKGLWNGGANRWDYEKYVSMYNAAWSRMKAADSTIKMGGPYVVSSSWSSGAPGPALGDPACTFNGGAIDGRALDVYSYFRDNATGWDFIVADIWVGNQFGSTLGAASNLAQLDKFAKQLQWIRDNIEPTKPIVIAEFYPCLGGLTASQAEDMLIDCFEVIRDGVDVQEGIWCCAWGEAAEPPNPINYTTGAATGLIQKLIDWEAAQA